MMAPLDAYFDIKYLSTIKKTNIAIFVKNMKNTNLDNNVFVIWKCVTSKNLKTKRCKPISSRQ